MFSSDLHILPLIPGSFSVCDIFQSLTSIIEKSLQFEVLKSGVELLEWSACVVGVKTPLSRSALNLVQWDAIFSEEPLSRSLYRKSQSQIESSGISQRSEDNSADGGRERRSRKRCSLVPLLYLFCCLSNPGSRLCDGLSILPVSCAMWHCACHLPHSVRSAPLLSSSHFLTSHLLFLFSPSSPPVILISPRLFVYSIIWSFPPSSFNILYFTPQF